MPNKPQNIAKLMLYLLKAKVDNMPYVSQNLDLTIYDNDREKLMNIFDRINCTIKDDPNVYLEPEIYSTDPKSIARGKYHIKICYAASHLTDEDKIELLKKEIVKRDRLVYTMMHSLSHDYHKYLNDDSEDIVDKLSNYFGAEKHDGKKIAEKKIEQMHSKLFKHIEK